MNTVIALVFTYVMNGSVYQDIPETFYSFEDCQQFVAENGLDNVPQFQCIELKP